MVRILQRIGTFLALRSSPLPLKNGNSSTSPPFNLVPRMSFLVHCPSCGRGFQVKQEFAGKVGKCTACGVRFVLNSGPTSNSVPTAKKETASSIGNSANGREVATCHCKCGAAYRVRKEVLGKHSKCPKCGVRFRLALPMEHESEGKKSQIGEAESGCLSEVKCEAILKAFDGKINPSSVWGTAYLAAAPKIAAKRLQNALKSFACEATKERPLHLTDRSFLMNGSKGMLVTNESICVEINNGRHRVLLKDIRSIELSTKADFIGNDTSTFIVNDTPLFTIAGERPEIIEALRNVVVMIRVAVELLGSATPDAEAMNELIEVHSSDTVRLTCKCGREFRLGRKVKASRFQCPDCHAVVSAGPDSGTEASPPKDAVVHPDAIEKATLDRQQVLEIHDPEEESVGKTMTGLLLSVPLSAFKLGLCAGLYSLFAEGKWDSELVVGWAVVGAILGPFPCAKYGLIFGFLLSAFPASWLGYAKSTCRTFGLSVAGVLAVIMLIVDVSIWVMRFQGPPSTRDPEPDELRQLAQKIASPKSTERIAAINQLSELGAAAGPAVGKLRGMLSDTDEMIRESAVKTLGRIGPKAHLALKEISDLVTHDPDLDVRREAALALARIGPRSAPYMVVLMERLQIEDNERVKKAIEEALRVVGCYCDAATAPVAKVASNTNSNLSPKRFQDGSVENLDC
jgi:hypothetical protein